MNELALFAGAGGGILGGKLLGWRTVCAVERDAYAAQVLAQRQNDGVLRPFPIWSDVQTFDGKPWCGIVDVISGGFPCQDISVAGNKSGITGERGGMWGHMARIISEVRPRYAFIENSPNLLNCGLDRVLCDLAALGFYVQWGVISAAECGAPHLRERIWIIADANMHRPQRIDATPSAAQAVKKQWNDIKRVVGEIQQGGRDGIPESWIVRKGDGDARRVDRTRAIGNAQVPAVAARAFDILSQQ